ncbi:MAG: Aldolase [Verrucomicrobiaceae bacterium]|nr:Aldolase [Verrucomicrobiaceae bacterium]
MDNRFFNCTEVAAGRLPASAPKAHVAVASLFGEKEMLIEEGTRIFALGADVIEMGNAFCRLVTDFNGGAAMVKSDSTWG